MVVPVEKFVGTPSLLKNPGVGLLFPTIIAKACKVAPAVVKFPKGEPIRGKATSNPVLEPGPPVLPEVLNERLQPETPDVPGAFNIWPFVKVPINPLVAK